LNPILIIFLSLFVLFSGILTLVFLREKNIEESGVKLNARVLDYNEVLGSSDILGYRLKISYNYFGLDYVGSVRVTEYNVKTFIPELLEKSKESSVVVESEDKVDNSNDTLSYFKSAFNNSDFVIIPIAVDSNNPGRVVVDYSELHRS